MDNSLLGRGCISMLFERCFYNTEPDCYDYYTWVAISART
jgi:hypothetical protein